MEYPPVSKWKWFMALVVAGVWSVRRPRLGARKLWSAVKLLFGGLKAGGLAGPEIAHARLGTCRKCPLFFAPLETCGSPLSKALRGLGCYCGMAPKVRLAEAECWGDLEIEDFRHGWKVNALPADTGSNPKEPSRQ